MNSSFDFYLMLSTSAPECWWRDEDTCREEWEWQGWAADGVRKGGEKWRSEGEVRRDERERECLEQQNRALTEVWVRWHVLCIYLSISLTHMEQHMVTGNWKVVIQLGTFGWLIVPVTCIYPRACMMLWKEPHSQCECNSQLQLLVSLKQRV